MEDGDPELRGLCIILRDDQLFSLLLPLELLRGWGIPLDFHLGVEGKLFALILGLDFVVPINLLHVSYFDLFIDSC